MSWVQYRCLQQKHVFITGGATGIGAAMLEAFCQQGARVSVFDLQAPAVALQQRWPAQLHFYQGDVTDIDALQHCIRQCSALNPLDVLVNNVANDQRLTSDSITAAQWRQCLAVNLDAAFFASQAALPSLRQRQGVIINFSSTVVQTGRVQMAGYTAAKAALQGLTRSLARENGQYFVRVNAIVPDWVATERQLNSWFTPELQAQWLAQATLPRHVLAEDVAALALFLASEQSKMITGQCLQVDGGMGLCD